MPEQQFTSERFAEAARTLRRSGRSEEDYALLSAALQIASRAAQLQGLVDIRGICCDCGVFGKKQREIAGAVHSAISKALLTEES